MASDDGGIVPDQDDEYGYGLDLFVDSWCDSCSAYVSIEEFGVQDEIGWNRQVCECDAVAINYRVAPWPREGMEFIGGAWQWPDEETMNEALTTAGAMRAKADYENIEDGESSDDSEESD
jgi:hypothetical protein